VALLAVIFAVLAIGAVLVIHGTLAKNRWGINFESVACPRCGTPAPRRRVPQSLREELWGGWTCRNCGVRVDKWGRELPGGGGPHFKIRESAPSVQIGSDTPSFVDWCKGRSPVFWALLFLLVILDILYDFYEPRGFILDLIAAAVLLVWYRHRISSPAKR
jgi:hypothetical protein